jgi:hypothetical protein
MTDVIKRLAAAAMDAGCPVCAHPKRLLLEAEIYGGRPNSDVARRYGIGDGPLLGSEIVRQHRLAGHMTPRDQIEGRHLDVLAEGQL